MDVVVQSSASEGLPNVLLEAAAAGRAIVATDVGGTGEIVRDGITGLLVDPGDRGALTQALRLAVTDAALRGRLGVNARAHVARAFTIERFVGQYAELYESLARSRLERSP
jgi:glycosyltransferase involved in cell wall biosynthesis